MEKELDLVEEILEKRAKSKKIKRTAEILRAMDCIALCVNDEEILEPWLMLGIADGDCESMTDEELVDMYGESLKELFGTFLRLMKRAGKDGLYAAGVVGTIQD